MAAVGAVWWHRRFNSYTPLDALADLRTVAQVQREKPAEPVRRFLELRYGALTEPANRQRAFEDLFNVGHIEGLYLLWHKDPNSQQMGRDVTAAAQTLAEYRSIMSQEERGALAAYFHSPVGRAQVGQATACYFGKDVRFRSAVAPVIRELLTTISDTQNP